MCFGVSKLNDHDDLEYGYRPVAVVALELMIRPDEILVVGTLPAAIDHPEPTENVWCEFGKRNINLYEVKRYYQAHTNRRK